MPKSVRVLLQTTIPPTQDDWGIERFSKLRDYLASAKDETGQPLFEVTARNRESDAEGNDPVLSQLDQSDFDEMWLFAVDTGNGITEKDCAGISAFREKGGGLLTTRDHQDLGSSLCTLAGVGAAHYFQSRNLDPDTTRHQIDDTFTSTISWPNYNSGRNGDCQRITIVEPAHEILRNPASPTGFIEYFPSHPHEGGVGAPTDDATARVIATGKSVVTQHSFNLAVVLEGGLDEQGHKLGRAIAESSFHHFCDYNWDTAAGAPSFVSEPSGETILSQPRALEDIQTYVKNAALWLAGQN